MKVILQKVKKASVSVDGKIVGEIDKGYCLLVGVHKESTEADAKYLAKKIVEARLFEDENEKLNLGLKDVNGSILSVSQFTLYADTKKGKRPSFTNAASAEEANELYNKFNEYLREEGIKVETGIFQTMMEVNIINDGPVTIIYEKLSLGN
ncbi:D-tyrosyl-tRNA(Tyr) deacylase [Gemella morbillorum]|jgi:D-tyrosyl-tRNA(Tyr) deacylase|uniref:D-aminoacyl-tRNA deacylase n=1 Tax=Gemella morbillorum TaxID=29391 RepID=A0A2X4NBM1_9BACL|nr:D-aminoacyl-tRNA deacylase [Gemella morbillorum]EFV35786.1 D-Tyr-tRNA(Tyr) deacylase [Gemella morbillorum M424]MBF1209499.1 D-tyrosyl-tRNA(Tyr) deacylase [Gemella morbillorum]MBF1212012.1 D-tyrosyl-tRNA(Tyr) deacylase [Gemella morbillorum]QGS09688.1 D-tyrosyl-tRNA(Tyr) deacylase [Gemella morbillorum]UBH81347.1 D-tyrosyl-tRNA(Tyr) deacylase [Gemella morbillorum]